MKHSKCIAKHERARAPLFLDSGDPVTGSVWLLSASGLFEIVITAEDRDVWKLYLDRAGDAAQPAPELFDTALKHCKAGRRPLRSFISPT